MVTGSTPKAHNQGQEKNSEKSSSKARDEMPSVCTSTNETTSDNVSCYICMAVHTSEARGERFFFYGWIWHVYLRLLHQIKWICGFQKYSRLQISCEFCPKICSLPVIKFRLWVLNEVLIIDLRLTLASLGWYVGVLSTINTIQIAMLPSVKATFVDRELKYVIFSW